MKKTILYLAIFMHLAAIPVHAQSTLALQEKCAEGGEKFVLRLHSVESYTSHYSKKLDGCFLCAGFFYGVIIEDMKLPSGSIITLRHPDTGRVLYNVFDGNIIGIYRLVGGETRECSVGNKKCKSIDEFEKSIKPYMAE